MFISARTGEEVKMQRVEVWVLSADLHCLNEDNRRVRKDFDLRCLLYNAI